MTSSATAAFAPPEIGVLARAVSRAPSVHNTQPWRLRVRGGDVDLLERRTVSLPRHDPEGRDRLLSCGAAVANLEIAARALGRDTTTSIPPDGEVAATVHTRPGRAPSAAELALRRAIDQRRSYRRPFSPAAVSDIELAGIVAAAGDPAVRVVLPRDLRPLGELLGFATRVFRDDPAYQRELDIWTAHTFGSRALGAVDGVPEAAMGEGPLPSAGLVRRTTPVPDDPHLAARLAAETFLVVCTEADGKAEHLAAGAALERIWLAATVRGLAGSVLTQPLHLTGFRERMVSRLGLPGLPQALFRCGRPDCAVPPSPRLPLGELLSDDSLGGPQ
ncbi:Acg family FMN-binding oxidoreductase [Amycolatopsis benzoatilytica]|uniref:Acg family FMN-binding oxidoreductase n=1 Tax=Amycolatopsis benzoatilytica TaxID=346045 RepID=UPI000366F7DA|nr:nitroreductase family protein [Amycolatopsis benzoatilytica]